MDFGYLFSIHGWWGAGKSTLLATLPGPRLALDNEARFQHIEKPHVFLKAGDFLAGKLPAVKDPDTSVIIPVTDPQVIREIINTAGTLADHPFESFAMDSVGRWQLETKRMVAHPDEDFDPNKAVLFDGWGRVLNNMLFDLDGINLLRAPSHPKPMHVGWSSPVNDEAFRKTPDLEGQLRRKIQALPDVHGFLSVKNDKEGKPRRVLQISPTEEIDAKCGLPAVDRKWGKGYIIDPDLTTIIAVAQGKETK